MKMSTYRSLLLLAVVFVATLASCNLEMAGPDVTPVIPVVTPPVNGSKIQGTWNFVGVTVKSNTTAQKDGATLSSYTEYITTDNKGVFVFDGKNMSFTGLAYTIDGTMRMTLSGGGMPETDITQPLMLVMPPYNSRTGYRETSSTTIYVEKGFVQDPSGMGVAESQAGEAKVSFDGDNMTLTFDLSQLVVPGTRLSGSQVIKFVKKK
jgi:hypothetical protein